MTPRLPKAKLPNLSLPRIKRIPQIPFVGCAPSSATTLVGKQFGNVPDLEKVLHIRALKKALEEQIKALIDGQLPVIARAPKYAASAVRLANELQQLLSGLAEAAQGMAAEYDAAVSFANGKIAELNRAAGEIQALPEAARSKVQKLTLDRYNDYAREITAQVGRLQQAKGCLG